MQLTPTLGPTVYKQDLLWGIWSPTVGSALRAAQQSRSQACQSYLAVRTSFQSNSNTQNPAGLQVHKYSRGNQLLTQPWVEVLQKPVALTMEVGGVLCGGGKLLLLALVLLCGDQEPTKSKMYAPSYLPAFLAFMLKHRPQLPLRASMRMCICTCPRGVGHPPHQKPTNPNPRIYQDDPATLY